MAVQLNATAEGGNMRPRRYIISTMVFLTLTPPAVLSQMKSVGIDGVRTADMAWLKAYAAKDLDKTMAFCDEQSSVLPSNAPVTTGKTAIAKLFAEAFESQDLTWHIDKAGVARSGELGYTSGSYVMTFKDATGKTVTDKGKYLTVWKKGADGSWKVSFDMFNSDLPPFPSS
jgi:ketosteroid isomerase-like protein